MAERLTYKDKTNPRKVVDRTQQATAEDFNEIKNVVNAHADDVEKLPGFNNIPAVADDLVSPIANAALSAKQGVIIKGFIDQILSLLHSDDTTLDELQEIVNYIKQNKEELQNLDINNISGLPQEFISVYKTIKDSFTASNIDTVVDWNTSTLPGVNMGLVRGSTTNGPTPEDDTLFFCLCFEFGSNNGLGNITQLAIPYVDEPSLSKGFFYRGRNNDTWSIWRSIGTVGQSNPIPVSTDIYSTTITLRNPNLQAGIYREILPSPGANKAYDILSITISKNLTVEYNNNVRYSFILGNATVVKNADNLRLNFKGIICHKPKIEDYDGDAGDGNTVADTIGDSSLYWFFLEDAEDGIGEIKINVVYRVIDF